jgi:uncharacterized Tic20 family protein
MTDESAAVSNTAAARKSRVVPVLGLLAAIAGCILTAVGFLGGIDAALNDSGGGALLFTILFFAGGVLVLAGLIIGIVCLVRGRRRVLAVVTIVLALLPVIGVIVLRLAAVGAS